MSGQDVFAKDASGNCYICYHPTDVRYVRESYEGIGDDSNEDWKQWFMLNEWAQGRMRESFIAENDGLTAISYGNTDLDIFLARAAYAPGTNYTLSTLEYGPLSPNGVDPTPYVERLTSNMRFEAEDPEDTPDGEYAVIEFPDEGCRFDFFFMPGKENYIRQTFSDGYEQLFRAVYADGASKASAIVQEWYDAIAAASGADAGNAALGYTPDDLVGTWAEKIAGRGVISISKGSEEGEYDVRIDWSSSAFEKSIWEMTAEPAGDGGVLAYENGKHLIRTYSTEAEYTDVVQYENGTGKFYLNSAFEVMWEDETAGQGDNCVFVNAG